ncbi:MAG: hypothetical protein CVU29_03120, partial [Betaproteobacteria bacterium HGW-Betaproteobacteria-22]
VSVYFEVFIEILLLIVYEKFLLLNVTIFRGDYIRTARLLAVALMLRINLLLFAMNSPRYRRKKARKR